MDFDYSDTSLDELCTNYQLNVLNAKRKYKTAPKGAKVLNMSVECFKAALTKIRVKSRARKSELHDATVNPIIPEGYHVKGASSAVRNGDGLITWIKTDIDKVKSFEAMTDAIEALSQSAPVREEISLEVDGLSDKLLNQYTFTDYHIGMLAWHREGGDNWNAEIATKTIKQTFTDMIRRAPKASTALINQLGDFLHFDSLTAETPTNGHPLDADTRPEKMVSTAIQCLDYLITESLRHHEKVIVVIAQGNHDLYSSIWLRKMFSHMYKDNERVEFIESSVPFYAYSWGTQMLGYHHGHKVKFDKLPALFMDQFREMYGATTKTAIHMGHYHHQEIKELGKTVIEQHRTLAARDAHASYGGYHSERASDVITYHKEHGEVSRCTVRPLLVGDC